VDSDLPDSPDFKDREAFDPDERELCSDGSCTGLLGADGRCKVCGRAGDGSPGVPRARRHADGDFAGSGSDARGEGLGDHGHDAIAGGDISGGESDDSAFADDDRQLCPDGACTGLLGTDGKCKVCGRSAAS
jgi:hypothetical protein